jgi:hypothetical protein
MHDIECSGEQQRQDLDRVALVGADALLDLDEDPVLLCRVEDAATRVPRRAR